MRKKPARDPWQLMSLVYARLLNCGMDQDELNNIPREAYREVALGKAMFIVKRGPGICPHCNRLRALVICTRPTKRPLEQLFQ